MIYDGHAYCFPGPGEHGGFEDPAEWRRVLKLAMATHRMQPVWRKSDRTPADSSGPADPSGHDFDALTDAEIRIASHGKIEWTADGVDYVKQVLPPWTNDFSFAPESLVAEMDYSGVDRALLHRTPYMGISNEYIAECATRFPDRIQGLAYIEEQFIESQTEASVAKLKLAIEELGLSGLQFLPYYGRIYGAPVDWGGPAFKPYWDAVAGLGIPVFFTLGASPLDAYLDELRALGKWMERYPDVKVVMTHGFNWRMFAEEDAIVVPDSVYEAAPINHPNFHVQLLMAVFLQSRWDYPMPQVQPVMRQMVERIGAERLVWGTDVPIVLLHWTYRQSLDYIRNYCDFIKPSDMDLILGGNMARLMGTPQRNR